MDQSLNAYCKIIRCLIANKINLDEWNRSVMIGQIQDIGQSLQVIEDLYKF